MVDSGLVFVVEKESSFLDVKRTTANDIELFNGDNQGHHHTREKTKTARKKSNSAKTLTQKCVNVENGDTSCTLIDAVTSTTNPTQATCLMPQVIERISEDSEVDIESIDDTATPSFQASSNMTGVKRRINERKTCQQLLRKARKLKCNSKDTSTHPKENTQLRRIEKVADKTQKTVLQVGCYVDARKNALFLLQKK